MRLCHAAAGPWPVHIGCRRWDWSCRSRRQTSPRRSPLLSDLGWDNESKWLCSCSRKTGSSHSLTYYLVFKNSYSETGREKDGERYKASTGTANNWIHLKKNWIYLSLAVLGLHCCIGFSLVMASRGYSLVAVCRLLITMTSLVVESVVPRHLGFRSRSKRAQQLWCMGLVALRPVGSPWTRIKLCLLHWQGHSLPLSHQGSPRFIWGRQGTCEF